MPPAFCYAWESGLALLGLIYPFVAVCCGRRLVRTALAGWGALVLYTFVICGVLPIVISHYDRALAYRLGDEHFEPPAIVMVFFAGWFYPLAASVLGYGCRQLWFRCFPPDSGRA